MFFTSFRQRSSISSWFWFPGILSSFFTAT
jgi:hypothetical protein